MKVEDPCPWCERALEHVEREGCGASRFAEACWLAPIVAELGVARTLKEWRTRYIR